MKKSKSPIAKSDLTTPQKKLRQARLPFKILSDVSPKPDTPPSRKRKLSAPGEEAASKIGKISKENDLVVISDDDKDMDESATGDEKTVNPLAKLVDTAWKKKLQKAKGSKKKKVNKINKSGVSNVSTESNEIKVVETDLQDVEMVDISQDSDKESNKPKPEGDIVQKQVRSTRSLKSNKTVLSPNVTEKNNNKKPVHKLKEDKNIDANESIVIDDDSVSSDNVKENLVSNEKVSPTLEENKIEKSDEKDTSCKTLDNSMVSLEGDKNVAADEKAAKKTPILTTPKRTRSKVLKDQPTPKDKESPIIKAGAKGKASPKKEIKSGNKTTPKKESPENKTSPKKDINPSKKTTTKTSPVKKTNSNEIKAAVKGKPSPKKEIKSDSKTTPKKGSPENKTSPIKDNITPNKKTTTKTSPVKKTNSNENKEGVDNKSDMSLNLSSSSNLNSSQNSLLVTPKQNKNPAKGEANTPLTPKQLQRKLESAKKKEEREKEKLDREKKRIQEKEERDKAKKEKEDLKKREREEKEEAKKKEREEKEELKRKEKEEKERQKEFEKKLKEEKEEQKKKEREEKEEQRRKEKEAKDEEKRKLESEKQEQELKKKKAAEAFVNFFVPKQKIEKESIVGQVSGNTNLLSSFTIKSDMRLAPTVRSDFNEERRSKLDSFLESQVKGSEELYVNSLKSGKSKPESTEKTWPLSERDDDVMIVEDELPPIDGDGSVVTCELAVRETLKPKLFRFHENRRPPYWGTWRKRSQLVKPRRPFGQDDKLLDYSIDSDDEWEEEAEGESLDGSVAGSDVEPQDEYELDNDVFVPHGYLSDEEATMDEEDVLKLSPEAQKERLKNLEDEFASELKKPTEKLKPRLYGLIWETSDGKKPEKCVDALWNYLNRFSMMVGDMDTLLKPPPVTEETEKKKAKKRKSNPEGDSASPKPEKKKKKKAEKVVKEKTPKTEKKTKTPDSKKNQLGINTFLKKINS